MGKPAFLTPPPQAHSHARTRAQSATLLHISRVRARNADTRSENMRNIHPCVVLVGGSGPVFLSLAVGEIRCGGVLRRLTTREASSSAVGRRAMGTRDQRIRCSIERRTGKASSETTGRAGPKQRGKVLPSCRA